jgi:hypothetical protein
MTCINVPDLNWDGIYIAGVFILGMVVGYVLTHVWIIFGDPWGMKR